MRKKSIEELQAELTLEADALATLQIIYAEKVKQVRTNTAIPPDIQARFLSEWETFYQQRTAYIFNKDYLRSQPSLAEPRDSAASAAVQSNPLPVAAVKPSPPPVQNAAYFEPPPPQPVAEQNAPEDILGVNTDSWMNSAESITYEQYTESEPISSSLMDSDKAQIPTDNLDPTFADDPDSIDGYAATAGLKGLTEFMDFDLKKRKS